jgi:hypothetical protein
LPSTSWSVHTEHSDRKKEQLAGVCHLDPYLLASPHKVWFVSDILADEPSGLNTRVCDRRYLQPSDVRIVNGSSQIKEAKQDGFLVTVRMQIRTRTAALS